ncbi:predicted protein [Lichtheimia corymbifera JMRC:FSU:9682]|uniref:Uncharacterized protein n=1 Tax=Lichtheimia corymbifera JMRC:FSU:9682 TaxID=1263082 RepID=A0A068RTC1_9FUNG|nr:predicted protein [Lichtheimia corymbifera JMRC:FSU:9682]
MPWKALVSIRYPTRVDMAVCLDESWNCGHRSYASSKSRIISFTRQGRQKDSLKELVANAMVVLITDYTALSHIQSLGSFALLLCTPLTKSPFHAIRLLPPLHVLIISTITLEFGWRLNDTWQLQDHDRRLLRSILILALMNGTAKGSCFAAADVCMPSSRDQRIFHAEGNPHFRSLCLQLKAAIHSPTMTP